MPMQAAKAVALSADSEPASRTTQLAAHASTFQLISCLAVETPPQPA